MLHLHGRSGTLQYETGVPELVPEAVGYFKEQKSSFETEYVLLGISLPTSAIIIVFIKIFNFKFEFDIVHIIGD